VPQAISKTFKDISLAFQRHPITNDVTVLTNQTAISRSIRNLVLTNVGEKFFKPNVGSRVNSSLFELLDMGAGTAIRSEIESTIKNYEPRVFLNTVQVTPLYDDNAFDVVISYFVVGQPNNTQTIDFLLQATR
jgi:phage baseplate assembly protein W